MDSNQSLLLRITCIYSTTAVFTVYNTRPVVMPASCTILQTATVDSEAQNKPLQNRFILAVHFYIQVIWKCSWCLNKMSHTAHSDQLLSVCLTLTNTATPLSLFDSRLFPLTCYGCNNPAMILLIILPVRWFIIILVCDYNTQFCQVRPSPHLHLFFLSAFQRTRRRRRRPVCRAAKRPEAQCVARLPPQVNNNNKIQISCFTNLHCWFCLVCDVIVNPWIIFFFFFFFTNLSEGNPLFACLPLQCWTILIEQFYLLLNRICDSSTTSQNLSTHSKRSLIWWITKASQSLWEQDLSFRQHRQFVDWIWIKIHVFNCLAFRFFLFSKKGESLIHLLARGCIQI